MTTCSEGEPNQPIADTVQELRAHNLKDFEESIANFIKDRPEYEEFYRAMLEARYAVVSEGLLDEMDDAGLLGQGARAAIGAREDVAATTLLQGSVLYKLNSIRKTQVDTLQTMGLVVELIGPCRHLLYVVIALLLYIAYQVT